ncbi:MAG: AI-2E family transporter, partial [Gaiellaceae bacterium]
MADDEQSRQGGDAADAAAAEADQAREAAAEADQAREAAAEQARVAAAAPGDDDRFGGLGHPLKQNSPFMLGFFGALGVFLAWFLTQALVQARSVIVLIVVALFLAVGLNPLVESLVGRGVRRGIAIAIVFLGVIAAFVGFGFAVVPPVIEETNAFVQDIPNTLEELRRNSTIRQFDEDYGVIERAQGYVTSGDLGQRLFGGLLGVGRVVLSAVFSALSLLILTLYFLAALPSMKRQAYRLVPASRRDRVQLLGDEILDRIGGFVGGALAVAFIAGTTSYVFLSIVDLPYALALAVFVGLLDLIPLVGATIAAAVVSTLG